MQTASPGTNTGAAPAAADASQASSAPSSSRPTGSIADRISGRAEQLSKDATGVEDPGTAQRVDLTEQPDPTKKTAETTDPSKKAEADKSKPKMIDERAFKERLGVEANKTAKAKQEAHQAKLEAQQARAAAQILQAQLDEIRQAHADGTPFDPKDDELRVRMVTEDARKRNAELLKQHQADLQQMNAEAAQQARREQTREHLSNEVDVAVSKFPGISRVELISRMTAAAKRKQAASAEQIASQLNDEFLVNARQRLGVSSEQPPAPTTARAPGARSTTRGPNNVKGYESYIKSMQP